MWISWKTWNRVWTWGHLSNPPIWKRCNHWRQWWPVTLLMRWRAGLSAFVSAYQCQQSQHCNQDLWLGSFRWGSFQLQGHLINSSTHYWGILTWENAKKYCRWMHNLLAYRNNVIIIRRMISVDGKRLGRKRIMACFDTWLSKVIWDVLSESMIKKFLYFFLLEKTPIF